MFFKDHILILININISVLVVVLWLPGRFPLYRGNIHWNIKQRMGVDILTKMTAAALRKGTVTPPRSLDTQLISHCMGS